MGFEVSAPKHVRAAESNSFVGMVTDMSRIMADGVVLMRPTADHMLKVGAAVAKHISSGRMSGAEAGLLHGKLMFILSPNFSRVGRAPLQALVHHQYHPAAGSRLDPIAMDSLAFVRDLLSGLPDARIPLAPPRQAPVVVLTDASWSQGSGEIGAIMVAGPRPPTQGPAIRRIAAADVPEGIIRALSAFGSDHLIKHLEVLAAVVPLESPCFSEELRGCTVIFCIDNKGAMLALIKGGSRDARLAQRVNQFWLAASKLGIRPFFIYVPSEQNLADLSSRDGIAAVVAMGFEEVPCTVPELRSWSAALLHTGL
mmetsp:Transcript_6168/g.14723  ORF Transcript_6168/g.14723 Transcript_6168/m.14723 type:complete len:312 (+) Transcript_6168:1125-2060(+)